MPPTEFALLLYDLGLVNREHGDRYGWLAAIQRRLAIHSPAVNWDRLKPQGILTLAVQHPAGNLLLGGGAMVENDGTGDKVRSLLDTYLANAWEKDKTKFLTSGTLQNIAERDSIRTRSSATGRHIGHVWSVPQDFAGQDSFIRNEDNDYDREPSTGVLINVGGGYTPSLWWKSEVFGNPHRAQLQPTYSAAEYKEVLDAHPDGHKGIFTGLHTIPRHRQIITVTRGTVPAGSFRLTYDNGTSTQQTGAISFTDLFISGQAATDGTAQTQMLNNIRYELSILSNIPQTGPTGGKVPGVAVFYITGSEASGVAYFDVYFFDENKRGSTYPGYEIAGYTSPETSDELALTAALSGAPGDASVSVAKYHENYTIPDSGISFGQNWQLLDRQMRPHLIPEAVSGAGVGVNSVHKRNVIIPDIYNWKTWATTFLAGWFTELLAAGVDIDRMNWDNETFTYPVTTGVTYSQSMGGLQYFGSGFVTGGDDNATIEWARYFIKQPVYAEFWRDNLPEQAQSDLAAGTAPGTTWTIGGNGIGGSFAINRNAMIDTACGINLIADFMNHVYTIANSYWPGLLASNWATAVQSAEMAVAGSQTGDSSVYGGRSLGTVVGTHQNQEAYTGGPPIATESDHYLGRIPNLAEDTTHSPCFSVTVKTLARSAGGVVTATAYSDVEVAASPLKGNDQQFAGYAVGDLITVHGHVSIHSGVSNYLPITTDPGPYSVLSVAVDGSNITFQQAAGRGADSDGPFDPPAWSGQLAVSVRRADNWQYFLAGCMVFRSEFAASTYPISHWWGTWFSSSAYTDPPHGPTANAYEPNWYHGANRDFLMAMKYHERLHNMGDDYTECYFPPGAYVWIGYPLISDPASIDDGWRVDATKALEFEDDFSDCLRNLDTLCPYKHISPLSCNYDRLSRQSTTYVLSGAALPNGTALYRLDWKPGANTGIIETADNYIRVRLSDDSVGTFSGKKSTVGITNNGCFLVYTP